MLIRVVEYSQNKIYVAAVKSTNNVVVNSLFYKRLRGFEKLKNSKK